MGNTSALSLGRWTASITDNILNFVAGRMTLWHYNQNNVEMAASPKRWVTMR